VHKEATVDRGRDSLSVIVAGLPSDAHTWNLVFLQLLLEDLGHRVLSLGPCVPAGELVARCREERPHLLVLSSVNGHGAHDALPVIAAIRADAYTAALPTVIGGKLDVSGAAGPRLANDLITAGYDAVFTDGAAMSRFQDFLGILPRAVTA
jgi:methylaspartate mutase sigma subunit